MLRILVTCKLSVYFRETTFHELSAILSQHRLFRHESFEEILKYSMSAL
jgi:hypothetical protein